jgi:hypothetical protein
MLKQITSIPRALRDVGITFQPSVETKAAPDIEIVQQGAEAVGPIPLTSTDSDPASGS